VAIALAETMVESGRYNVDSTTVRDHDLAAGGKGGFVDELLALGGTPIKFTVSLMPEVGPSLSTSRTVKPQTAKPTTL